MNILIVRGGPAGLAAGLILKRRHPAWSVTIGPAGNLAALPAQVLTNPVLPTLHLGEPGLRAAILAVAHQSAGIAVVRGVAGETPEVCFIPGLAYSTAGLEAIVGAILPLAQAAGCVFAAETVQAECDGYDLVLVCDAEDPDDAGLDTGAFDVRSDDSGRVCCNLALSAVEIDVPQFSCLRTSAGLITATGFVERSGQMSMILEADKSTVQALGLAGALPETLAGFVSQLAGGKTSGASIIVRQGWQVADVRSAAARRSGKVIIFGAAVAGIHHSIGLQTRHDLEEAQSLAIAIADAGVPGPRLDAALEQWEGACIKRTASYQRAAAASAQWLAEADRYCALPMEQFAFACATRSHRMGYKRVRDAAPDFADRLDRLAAGLQSGAGNSPPPPMFTPYGLRDLELPNRLVFSPMCMYSATDGTVNDFHTVHLGARATGGFGLVIAEMTNVTAQGRMTLGCAGMYAPAHVPAWRRVTAYVHTHTQSRIGIQLAHAGRKGSIGRSWEKYEPIRDESLWEVLAPSPIPFTPDRPLPREMTLADIQETIDAFARAARMSVDAGFDMIELHMAHGYLISEFISPLANRRGDAYGGSLANRMRFPLEVYEAVRSQVPDGMPIAARISATDFDPAGVTPAESIKISRILHEARCDIIAVSTAGVTSARRPTMAQRLYQLSLCEAIRHEAKTPAMAIGGLVSHTDCNMIIASGRADLCVMARGAMNQPYFPHHAAHEQGHVFDWPLPYARADETVIRAS
jgi:anthraniloyl-CoA monooxygenase